MEAGLGVCVGEDRLDGLPLRPDATMELPAEVSDHSTCGVEGRRRMYWAHVPVSDGCWSPAVHSTCVHNETASLLLRTLGPTPEDPAHKLLAEQFSRLRKLSRRLDVQRWSLERVVESYSGRLRKRYDECRVHLREGAPLSRDDKRIEAFLKAEKFNPLVKPSKPRMIMARNPRTTLCLASRLKPFEKALWGALKGGPKQGVEPTRQVGKGLNGIQRAALIDRKMREVGEGCVVFEVDGKAFEAHCTVADIAREHSVYRAAFKGDVDFHKLLDIQLVLKGRTTCGIKFRREGARASGDFNTGLGNSVIMNCIVDASMMFLMDKLNRAFRWDKIVDGDNALIFVEPEVAYYVHKHFAAAVQSVSAQEMTVENPVTELEQVVFGQSKPCWNGNHYTMVREPFKSVSNAFSSYRHYNNWNHGVRVIKSVSACELALARGIPVLEPYFAKALDLVGNVPDLLDPTPFLEGRQLEAVKLLQAHQETLADVKPVGVTMEARLSFEKAWGLSVEEQLLLEDELCRNLEFPILGGTGVWASFRRWFRKNDVSWDPVLVTDGPDGEVPSESIVSYFDRDAYISICADHAPE